MKEKHLEELGKLDEKILERLVEVSKSAKAKSYFTNPILYASMKTFLGVK